MLIIVLDIVRSFLKKYWYDILIGSILAILLFILYELSYSKGELHSEDRWTSKYNDYVQASNAKIQKLQQESIDATVDSKLQLDTINKQLLLTENKIGKVKIVYRDKKGKKIICPIPDQEVYLGQDFQILWNEINAKGKGSGK